MERDSVRKGNTGQLLRQRVGIYPCAKSVEALCVKKPVKMERIPRTSIIALIGTHS